MTEEKFVAQTKAHAADVSRLVNFMCNEAMKRGKKHDHSKYDLVKGYVDYLTAKEEGKDTKPYEGVYIEHCKRENHHAQKIQNESCDLLDILEMLCDWVSASAQRSKILDPNQTRFPSLNWEKILRNTLKEIVKHY